jgi:hypothetical protein
VWAKNSQVEALLEATCDEKAGTVLRAPTPDEGLSPACKDTFAGTLAADAWFSDRAWHAQPVALEWCVLLVHFYFYFQHGVCC